MRISSRMTRPETRVDHLLESGERVHEHVETVDQHVPVWDIDRVPFRERMDVGRLNRMIQEPTDASAEPRHVPTRPSSIPPLSLFSD